MSMKLKSNILNNQDYRENRINYLSHYDIETYCGLRHCSLCEMGHKQSKTVKGKTKRGQAWYIVIRRNLRAITLKCRYCGFQFTTTYHNLNKGLIGFHQLAMAENLDNVEYLTKMQKDIDELKTWDFIEKRGK
jgi:hypothetical protein